jgi:hypothetical protein
MALSRFKQLLQEEYNQDWDTLHTWLDTFSTDNGEFLIKHNIISGNWLKKALETNRVTVDQLDKIATNPAKQVFSDLPVAKRALKISEQTGTGAIGVGAGPISTPNWVMPKGEKTNPGTKAMQKLGFKKVVMELIKKELNSYKNKNHGK